MFKKSIAVCAALLLMSSSLNANSKVYEEESYACFVASDNLAAAYAAQYGWTYEQEYAAFIALYDTCVAAGGGNQ